MNPDPLDWFLLDFLCSAVRSLGRAGTPDKRAAVLARMLKYGLISYN